MILINIVYFIISILLQFDIIKILAGTFFSIVLYILMQKANDFRSFVLYSLILFLPFYATIRAFSLLYNYSNISGLINYLRDFVILFLAFITLIKKNLLLRLKFTINDRCYKNMLISIIFLSINYIYGFIISFLRGYYSLGIKGVHLNLIPLLLVFVVYNISYDTRKVDRLFKFIVDIGVVVSLIGIYFYIFRPPIFGELLAAFRQNDEMPFQVINYSRMVSVFLSPNVFGAFMAIATIISMNELIYKKNIAKNVYLITALIICVIGLVLSMSRGAWMFALSGIIMLIFYNKNNINIHKKVIKVIALLLLLLAIFILINPELQRVLYERFRTILNFNNESSYGRLSNWTQALNKLFANFFGFGLGVGGINLINHPEISQDIGLEVIDGFYVKAIVETGVIGILLFSAHLILMLNSLLKLSKNGIKEYKKYYIVTLAIFVGALFQSFGSNVFDFVAIAPLIWIFVGVTFNLSNKKLVN
jgi:hypothetical protein